MTTYIFSGTQPIYVPQFGTIEPGQEVTSVEPINHPDFKPKGDTPKRAKK